MTQPYKDLTNAFLIHADRGQIYLKIDEAFGFPTSTSHWGGYDTQSSIEIKSGNYLVKVMFILQPETFTPSSGRLKNVIGR